MQGNNFREFDKGILFTIKTAINYFNIYATSTEINELHLFLLKITNIFVSVIIANSLIFIEVIC